jgi:ADP-ribosylglycohydrolase
VLTHGHPSGYLSAAYLAALVHDLARGAALPEAITEADRLLRQERDHEEIAGAVAQARALAASGLPSAEALQGLDGGWVGEEALAIALACALTADTAAPAGVAEALWRAVCHSGDSDSTGSITGNVQGAPRRYGEFKGAPRRVASSGSAVTGRRGRPGTVGKDLPSGWTSIGRD